MSKKNSLNRLRKLSAWRNPLIAMVAVLALALSGIGISAANAATLGSGVDFVTVTTTNTPVGVAARAGDVLTYSVTATNKTGKKLGGLAWSFTGAVKTKNCSDQDIAQLNTSVCTATHTVTAEEAAAGAVNGFIPKLTGKPDGNDNFYFYVSAAQDFSLPKAPVAPAPVVAPALSISATSDSKPAKVNDVITYSVTVTNTAGPSLAGVSISNSAVDFETCAPKTLAAKNDTLVCSATHHVSQPEVDAGSFSTTFTGASTTAGASSKTATVETSISGTAALGLVKTRSSDVPTRAGNDLTWSIVATNNGTRTLNNVVVTDPRATTLARSGHPLEACLAETLAPGYTLTCAATQKMFQVDINAGGYSNTAYAEAADALHGTRVDAAPASSETAIVKNPSWTVEQSEVPTAVHFAGDVITRSVKVTNTGNITLADPELKDDSATFSGCVLSGPDLTFDPNETFTCESKHELGQQEINEGVYSNTVKALSSTDSSQTGVTASGSVYLTAQPRWTVVQDAVEAAVHYANHPLIRKVTVTNTGNVSLATPVLTDGDLATTIDNCKLSGANAVFDPSETYTCDSTHTVSLPEVNEGIYTNTVTATSATDAAQTSVSDTKSAVILAEPKWTIEQAEVSDAIYFVGDPLVRRVTVKNTGNVTLHGLKLNDATSTFDNCTTAGADVSLDPSASFACDSTHPVSQPEINSGSFSNTVTATTTTDSTQTDVSAHGTAKLIALPRWTVSQTAIEAKVRNAGTTVTRTVSMSNTGNVTLAAPALGDPSVTMTECAISGAEDGTFDPGDRYSCLATHLLSQGEVNDGVYNFTVKATSATVPLRETVTATSSAQITADPKLNVIQSQKSTDVPTKAGDKIVYTVTAANDGNVTLAAAVLSDAFATFTSSECATYGDLIPGASFTCETTHEVSQPQVDTGWYDNAASASATFKSAVVEGTSDMVHTVIAGMADMNLLKTQTSVNARQEGNTITWSVVATNTGTRTLRGVAVTDAKASLSCDAATVLAPNASVTCIATHKLTDKEFESNFYANSALATTVTGSLVRSSNTVNSVFGGNGSNKSANRTLTLASVAATPQLTTKPASFKASPSVTGGEIRYVVRSSSTTGCIIDNNSVIARTAGTCVIGATIEPYRTLTSAVAEDISITFVAPAPVVKAPVSIRSISSGRDR